MNSLLHIDRPVVLVSIYFLRNIFSSSFTLRFPMCSIIILAYFSVPVLCYVTAVLTLVLICIKTERKP
jgi:hypothetical protein